MDNNFMNTSASFLHLVSMKKVKINKRCRHHARNFNNQWKKKYRQMIIVNWCLKYRIWKVRCNNYNEISKIFKNNWTFQPLMRRTWMNLGQLTRGSRPKLKIWWQVSIELKWTAKNSEVNHSKNWEKLFSKR